MDAGLFLKQCGKQLYSHDHPHSCVHRFPSEEVVNNKERVSHEYLSSAFMLASDLAGMEATLHDRERACDYMDFIQQGSHVKCTLRYIVRNLWTYISANCMKATRSFVYLYTLNRLSQRMHYDGETKAFYTDKATAERIKAEEREEKLRKERSSAAPSPLPPPKPVVKVVEPKKTPYKGAHKPVVREAEQATVSFDQPRQTRKNWRASGRKRNGGGNS